jgi:hypothetical protein
MPSPLHIGLVADLCRFPVKSMAGERLDEAILTPDGVLGDRALALFDVEGETTVSASNKHFPGLLDWRATYVTPPELGVPLPPIRISAPTGSTWSTDDASLTGRLSEHFGRPVSLVRTRPPAYAARQAAFFADAGLENVAPEGTLVDLCPVSVISSATLDELGRRSPASRFDPQRFRMNLHVRVTTTGFPDNEWVDADLVIGQGVRLHVAMPDPRCSMITLPQGDLPKDPGILRITAEANSRPVGASAPQPCAGVYATVVIPGTMQRGDSVQLVPR